jgi:hypothetical protein
MCYYLCFIWYNTICNLIWCKKNVVHIRVFGYHEFVHVLKKLCHNCFTKNQKKSFVIFNGHYKAYQVYDIDCNLTRLLRCFVSWAQQTYIWIALRRQIKLCPHFAKIS